MGALAKQKNLHKTVQTPFYYGWIIVMMGALGVFFSGPGQTYSNAVFIDYYLADFGWSRSVVSSVYSFATLLAGLLMIVVGRYIDKYGQRFAMVFVASALALACFFNSTVTNSVMLFIGFFLIRLFGQGSMTLVPNTLVPQWFIEKRGRAFSLMAIGGFLSSATFPLLNLWMIEQWGWQHTWRIWGFLLLIIFVPLTLFFVRNKPEDIGLLPDNRQTNKTTLKQSVPVEEESWSLSEAKKTKTFWLLLFCVSIPAMVNTGLTFHLLSIFTGNELSPALAATVLSLMAIVGFPITVLSGFILEKIQANYMLVVTFIGQILFLLLLIFSKSIILAVAFGVLWGIVGGVERIALNVIWPNFFGRKHIGSIKGLAMSVMVIGSAFGPLPFGIFYDFFGGYNEILLVMMIFPALGAVSALLAEKPIIKT
ncbi:MFS transporter [Cytobacillus sp. S13-E01]|uniref:MFS transporter n=1 Tax=Cytobacillus sp. S13-E01 TaxID=3031326 RepID=UPI0023D7F08D|nr:MFS transporter [Cytobacillus sp. S13-E01]MDF0727283.1 MFS transporter [Cytobacillus sp. S13-E01]